MNKHVIILFFLAVALAGAYYSHQQGYFKPAIVQVEKALEEICDPAKEDCSSFEEDLQV